LSVPKKIAAVPSVAFVAGFAVAQTMTQTGREQPFENAEVKVWKSLVLPNNPLPLHRHEHPRVIVALKGGTMKVLEEIRIYVVANTRDWSWVAYGALSLAKSRELGD
jgi:hypothetical protein